MSNLIENENPTVQLLLDAGFTNGWVVSGELLILWEHVEDPPPPLVRPAT
jgi:hypothetical protein